MKYIILVLFAAILLPSCYPSYGLTTTDYRTTITLYDTATNFQELGTYYIHDSVFHILSEGDRDTITRDYDEQIIEYVASNFATYQWRRITDTTGGNYPTTTVKVSVTGQTTFGTYWNYWSPWYPSWGGGWWGYPGWGWGGYYPPYWGGGGTYSYSTGSLIIQQDKIVVPADPSDSLDLEPIWIGSSNGLLSSNTATNLDIVAFSIRQMFTQSPYLNVSKKP